MGPINPNRRFSTMGQRLVQIGFAVCLWLMAAPSQVYAHGMMAGEDLSRPMAVSGTLAFVSYWVVLLWPRRRKIDTDASRPLSTSGMSTGRQNTHKRSHALRLVSH